MSKCGMCGEDFGSGSHQILACKVTRYKEAISIVLDELHHRLPSTPKHGFLAGDPEVYKAVASLLEFIKKDE